MPFFLYVDGEKGYQLETTFALKKLFAGRNTTQKVVTRTKIVLTFIYGTLKRAIAKERKIGRPPFALWNERYNQ